MKHFFTLLLGLSSVLKIGRTHSVDLRTTNNRQYFSCFGKSSSSYASESTSAAVERTPERRRHAWCVRHYSGDQVLQAGLQGRNQATGGTVANSPGRVARTGSCERTAGKTHPMGNEIAYCVVPSGIQKQLALHTYCMSSTENVGKQAQSTTT